MSFEKAIKYNKEKRKEYKDSRRFDRSCRSNGGCPWCERNRKYRNEKREPIVENSDV